MAVVAVAVVAVAVVAVAVVAMAVVAVAVVAMAVVAVTSHITVGEGHVAAGPRKIRLARETTSC